MMYSPTQQFLIYTGLFFAALVFSLMINSVFMRFARNLGIREQNQAMERWSASAKPAFGGIGFFILFLVSFTLHGVLFPEMTLTALRPDLLGLLAATSLGFIMGLADDAYNTNPLLKLVAQLCCGVILIASGTCIDVFETRWFNIALTIDLGGWHDELHQHAGQYGWNNHCGQHRHTGRWTDRATRNWTIGTRLYGPDDRSDGITLRISLLQLEPIKDVHGRHRKSIARCISRICGDTVFLECGII
ncbi:MAG: hypothetical protein IPI91_08995 [Flavobacteriales bacterium]|nr:hypothetical protein [Flavobacteriales bacterium]